MIRLIMGGTRSGKSSFAERIANSIGGSDVIYLATAEIRDEEMKKRVKRHRQDRPASWQTIEEPYQVSKVLENVPRKSVVLLDCITVLISNLLLRGEAVDKDQNDFKIEGKEIDILSELESVIKAAQENKLELIMVTNEVGLGLVPTYKLGREYRDISGKANHYLAQKADEVYLLSAGLAIEIKEMGLKNLAKFS